MVVSETFRGWVQRPISWLTYTQRTRVGPVAGRIIGVTSVSGTMQRMNAYESEIIQEYKSTRVQYPCDILYGINAFLKSNGATYFRFGTTAGRFVVVFVHAMSTSLRSKFPSSWLWALARVDPVLVQNLNDNNMAVEEREIGIKGALGYATMCIALLMRIVLGFLS